MRHGGDRHRRSANGDLRLRGRRHGRRGAVPAGAFGSAPRELTAVTGYPVGAAPGREVVARARASDAERLPAATDHGGEPFAGTAEGSAS
jgi:hypothetical protein